MRTGTNFWVSEIVGHQIGDPTSKLLLLALADHVDAADSSFPSVELLAAEAECTEVTARRRLKALAERGLLHRVRRKVPRSGGGYQLGTYTYTFVREAFAALPPARSLITGDDAPVDSPAITPVDSHGDRAEPPNLEPPNAEPNAHEADASSPPKATDNAGSILRGFMDWCDAHGRPRPVNAGHAGKVIRQCLDAGWNVRDVKRALIDAPTVTAPAMEFQLRRATATSPPGDQAEPERLWPANGFGAPAGFGPGHPQYVEAGR